MFEAKLEEFFLVLVVSNTARFKRRYELFKLIESKVKASGVDYVIVELALGNRHFEVTDSVSLNHLRLRTIEELWHKENMVNLGIAHGRKLWPGKKNVGWIDADCEPVGRSMEQWFAETWHELQHYQFVQMWEYLQPLNYRLGPLGTANPSFMSNYVKYGTPYPKKHEGYPQQWGSPGLAWAANLEALDHIGGIPDTHILGGGDWWLAHMLISGTPVPGLEKYTPEFQAEFIQQQVQCERWIKRDVGYVQGLYTHYFHGKIVNRGYNTRENILIKGKFNPRTDIKKDHQGLWQLETWEPRQIWMRDQIRQYFRARDEDSIDSF